MASTMKEFLENALNETKLEGGPEHGKKKKKKKVDEDIINEKRFPPKSIDYNKVDNPDGFWKLSLADAKRISGASYERATEIGDLIMFLNMAAEGWKRTKGKF